MELPTHKTCTKCGEEKLLEAYYARKDCLFGVSSRCKACASEIQKNSRDRINAASLKRRLRDPEGEFIKKKISREKTKEADDERVRQWRLDNPSNVSKQAKDWRKANPDAAKEISRKYNRNKRSTAKGRLEGNIARGVHRGLTSGSKARNRTFSILSYSVEDLMSHIEKQFLPGMTWDNYGDWHVDHRIPLVAFNYETPDDAEFKMAWALSNLQPLWAQDNHSKGGRLYAELQPSLSKPLDKFVECT
ncbi:hypothetical protein ACC782_33770 [Rhizobium ruizarguesonis]